MDIQFIKDELKKRKITYPKLAEMTGLSISTITKIFGGYAKYPRMDTMEAIEKALGLSEDVDKISEPKLYDLTEKEKRLLDAFRALIPSLRDYLIETAEKLVEASSNGSKIEKRKA